MSSSPRDERWRNAALTGQFSSLRGIVEEMVGSNWPRFQGHIYMREYGKPGEQSEDKDRKAYAAFAGDLYLNRYFHGAPEQRTAHRDIIRGMASSHYDEMIKTDYPVTAEGAQAAGVQVAQEFNYYVPQPNGTQDQRFYRVSMLNIGAHKCAHCATNVAAKKAQPDNCSIVSPDEVFTDRLDYFGTTMHELAHSIRELQGDLKYDTPADRRREENIAEVFQGLMQAKVFGAAGMLQMRMDAIKHYNGDQATTTTYEAIGPMLAAVAFVDEKQQAGLAKMSPANLLKVAAKLVESNDLTRGMTPEQETAFRDFLQHADRRPEIAGKRHENLTKPTEDGLTRTFTIIAQKPGGGLEIKHEATPYLPQMAVVDQAFARYGTLESSLRDMQMRLNPMRPQAMARDDYHAPDVTNFYDPKWQAALFDFSKGYNHPSCDIPAIFRKELDELDKVRAENAAARAGTTPPPPDAATPVTAENPPAENAPAEEAQQARQRPRAAPGATAGGGP